MNKSARAASNGIGHLLLCILLGLCAFLSDIEESDEESPLDIPQPVHRKVRSTDLWNFLVPADEDIAPRHIAVASFVSGF